MTTRILIIGVLAADIRAAREITISSPFFRSIFAFFVTRHRVQHSMYSPRRWTRKKSLSIPSGNWWLRNEQVGSGFLIFQRSINCRIKYPTFFFILQAFDAFRLSPPGTFSRSREADSVPDRSKQRIFWDRWESSKSTWSCRAGGNGVRASLQTLYYRVERSIRLLRSVQWLADWEAESESYVDVDGDGEIGSGW